MGASSSRISKVQLVHGITSCATSLAQLSSSLPHWNNPLFHLSSIHNSKHNTQATLPCLHTRTNACTRSTSACFHALVRLCYGHKQRAQTSCGTRIHASNECGQPIQVDSCQNGGAGVQRGLCA